MKSSPKKYSVQEIAAQLQVEVVGDANVEITAVASISKAHAGALVFVEEEKDLSSALQSSASAVIAGDFAISAKSNKPLLIAKQARLAFARAARILHSSHALEYGIHPTAMMHASARLGKNLTVEARVVIGKKVEVGDGSRIGAGCVIGDEVKVGHNCEIYPNVTLYPGTKIGNRVIIHAGAVLGSDGFGYVRDKATGRYEKFPQIGRLEIEDDVEIGANTTIDRGALEITRIGRGTKIDNLVHVGHNCQIGEDVVIAAQAGFSGSIVVENNVVLGGQVGIGEHARIGEGVLLGGQGGVLPKKILRGKGVAFWGTPAQPLREYLKQLAIVAQLARKAKK